jgi:hypothetical protein
MTIHRHCICGVELPLRVKEQLCPDCQAMLHPAPIMDEWKVRLRRDVDLEDDWLDALDIHQDEQMLRQERYCQ